MSKTAVILFNLGGPDSLKAVKPFLFNLFNDKAVIDLPQPLRYLLAKFIAFRRTPKARAIYQHMGGKSPILENSRAQAEALEAHLKTRKDAKGEYKVFVSMRYAPPQSHIALRNVLAYQPDRVILLPLYPQFSASTTGSSFNDWERAARELNFTAPTSKICCYPTDLGFIAAHAKLLKDFYWKAAETAQPRVLFSAHGLPEKMIEGGDPYQWQVERTVAALIQVLAIDALDYRICYQSRVGRLTWIGPSTDEEVQQAGKDQVPVLVVPIAFVSEHSETLVELDHDYRILAEKHHVPGYWRVPALGTEPLYIETLADLCLKAPETGKVTSMDAFCPDPYTQCICRQEKAA